MPLALAMLTLFMAGDNHVMIMCCSNALQSSVVVLMAICIVSLSSGGSRQYKDQISSDDGGVLDCWQEDLVG